MGTQSFEDFASGLKSLGDGLVSFSNSVQGVDSAAIATGVDAAAKLSNLQNSLEPINGILQFILGQGDLGSFGINIAFLGTGLKSFSDSVKDIDVGAISAGVDAASKLAKLQSSLDNIGGLITLFTGDNSLGSFGGAIKKFGSALKDFSDSVSGIDADGIGIAVSSARKLNNLDMSNIKSLEDNTSGIPVFGRRMKSLGSNIADFPSDTCKTAGGAVSKLAGSITKLTKINVGAIENVSSAVKKVGTDSINKINSAFRNGTGQTISVIRSYLSQVASSTRSYGKSQMSSVGKAIGTSFVNGIKSKTGATTSASRALANAARSGVSGVRLYSYGAYAGAGFANGLRSQYGRVYSAAASLARAASAAVRANLSIHSPSRVMYGLGDFSVAGFVNALIDGAASAKSAGKVLVDGALNGVRALADKFSNLVDTDFSASPEIKPVLNLDDYNNNLPNGQVELSQNGYNYLGHQAQVLASNANVPTSYSQQSTSQVVNHYTVNNQGLLDGSIFQVREESDIRKIAKEINRLENETMYRKGIIL